MAGRAALWAAFCLLPAGCAVGPNYVPPRMDVPPSWHGISAPAVSQPSVPTPNPAEISEWWKVFQDSTLSSLVDRAIESNLDMRQAQARIRQARAVRGVVSAGLFPSINASGGYQRSFSAGSAGNVVQDGLDASWELDIFGGLKRSVEAAQANLQAVTEDRRDLLVSLVADVGTNYFNLRGLQQQIVAARANLRAQQRTAEITRKRQAAGYVSALDVANANAQEASLQSQIPLFESDAQATIYRLSILLGKEPAALHAELSTDAAIPVTPPDVPIGLPSDLLRRRPDIRRAEAKLHAATAGIGVATADLFPRFSLSGALGFTGSALSSLVNLKNRFWSVGPGVLWPVFDAGRIRSNIEIQNALQEQALAAYKKTVLTALLEVEIALTAYAKEQERRRALIDAVNFNRKAMELATTLYSAGRTDFLNILNAERSLYGSEDALVQSTRNLDTGLARIYKALGGGWEKDHWQLEKNPVTIGWPLFPRNSDYE